MKGKDEHGNDSYKDMTTRVKNGNEGSCIDRVFTTQTNDDGDRMIKVRTCQSRKPIMGDKFSSRNCQKGTFGIILKKQDLPYTEDGIVPDIILDPASYPTRMTLSQLIEILFGNLASELGLFGCYNAFENVNIENINDILETKLGLTSMGNRILYNGMSGVQMETTIFTGIIYYQRLKYMVDDKLNTRESGLRENGVPIPGGAYTVKERQSVAGRANGGGLCIGEMERDVLLAHGIWGFIKESCIERCDKFIVQVSKASGEISICNPQKDLFYDNITDGTVSYQLRESSGQRGLVPENIIGLNMYNQKHMDYVQIIIPYAFKLLLQEMQGMCMNVRMNVDYINEIISIDDESDDIIELTNDEINGMIETADFEQGEEIQSDSDSDSVQDGGGDDDDDDDDDEGSNNDNDEANNNDNDNDNDNDEGSNNDNENYANGGSNNDNENYANGGSNNYNENYANGGSNNANGDSNNTNGDSEEHVSEYEEQQFGGNSNSNSNDEHQQQQQQQQQNLKTNSEFGQNSSLNGGAINNNSFQRANLNSDIITNFQQNNQHTQGNQNGGMEVHMDKGPTNDYEHIDLSSYGGSKPEFNIKESDDNQVIEDMNFKLLGLHTGGTNDSLQNAKTHGINTVLSSNKQNINQNTHNNNNRLQPSLQNGGMNMSYGMQQKPMQQQPMQQQLMQHSGGMNMSYGNGQIGNTQNGNKQNNISFDSNVKVVELDTKVSDGFFYSGSKNLDPFRN